jgi:hypothetical protein
MLPSINNYSLTAEPAYRPYQTFNRYENIDEELPYSISITLRSSVLENQNGLNSKHLQRLSEIENLEQNWDNDGAIAPPVNVVQFAKAIIYIMNAIGQEIYNIAPGPDGEIMLLFTKDKKSFEVLIYPDKMRFVKFPEYGTPVQGTFSIEALYTDLLSWLNS